MIPVSSRMRASTRAAIALIVGVPLLGFASTQAREHPRADPDPLPTHAVFLPLVAKHPLAAPILLTPPDGYVAPDGGVGERLPGAEAGEKRAKSGREKEGG